MYKATTNLKVDGRAMSVGGVTLAKGALLTNGYAAALTAQTNSGSAVLTVGTTAATRLKDVFLADTGGWTVAGSANIPSTATISSIDKSAGTVTLSANTTGNVANAASLTFSNPGHIQLLKSKTLQSLVAKRLLVPCDNTGTAVDPYRRRGPISTKPQPTYLSPAVLKTVVSS